MSKARPVTAGDKQPRQSAQKRPLGLEGFGEPLELFSVTESKFILNFKPLPYIFDILRRLKSYEGQRLLELRVSLSLCLYFLSYCDISPPLPISHRTHNGRARTRTNWPLVRQNGQSGFASHSRQMLPRGAFKHSINYSKWYNYATNR